MEQWVRDGRHLTEDGKGVCDCIIRFSYEDSALAGLVESIRSNYIKFDDFSKKKQLNISKLLIKKNLKKSLMKL